MWNIFRNWNIRLVLNNASHFTSMTTIVIFIILVVALLFLSVFVKALSKSSKPRGNYVLNSSLVTPAERSFLGCLDSVLPSGVRIFAKVRLADLFSVEDNGDRASWRSDFNRISNKHIDFLLCSASDLSPLVAIELDDKSHAQRDRQQRDEFLDSLFAASKIRLLRLKVQRSYSTGELAKKLNEAM